MKRIILAAAMVLAPLLAPPALASYVNNNVNIILKDTSYVFSKGTFTVTALKITSGQDPNGVNYVGMVKTFSNTTPLSFSVGQEGSTDVADWFNNLIAADQNTFDHTAGSLQFAFMGTMELTFSGGNLAPYSQTFTLEDVMVAQGYSDSHYNWWFGGQNCDYVSDDTVECDGASPTGYPVTINFKRGTGNPADEVDMTDIELEDFSLYNLRPGFVGESTSCLWQSPAKCPPMIVYNTTSQSNTIRLSVNGNKLIDASGAIFDTSRADPSHNKQPAAIYVMDQNGVIYASRQNKVFLYHHSTLLAGKPVAAAGEMSVQNGVIQWLNNCSGHYLPPAYSVNVQVPEALSRQHYTGSYNTKLCTEDQLENLLAEMTGEPSNEAVAAD